jgi:hypothetical protein
MMVAVPSVAMNALTLSLTTIKPLTRPMMMPAATATAIAAHMFQLCCCIKTAAITAVRLTTAPMDRSNTPVASGTMTAMPSMAPMAWDEAIVVTVDIVRNRCGVQMPNMMMKAAPR